MSALFDHVCKNKCVCVHMHTWVYVISGPTLNLEAFTSGSIIGRLTQDVLFL